MNCLPKLLLLALTLASPATPTAVAAEKLESKPNIAFVLIDDMGWNGVGCYGNEIVPTPNIDKLAKEGAKYVIS